MDRFLTKNNSSQPSASFRDNSSRFIDEFDLQSLKPDPGERISIDKYSPRIRDEVRIRYIQQGPCQPRILVIMNILKLDSKRKCVDFVRHGLRVHILDGWSIV